MISTCVICYMDSFTHSCVGLFKSLVIVNLGDDQVHYRNFTSAQFGGQSIPTLPHAIDNFKGK